jgi:hypothetical protein
VRVRPGVLCSRSSPTWQHELIHHDEPKHTNRVARTAEVGFRSKVYGATDRQTGTLFLVLTHSLTGTRPPRSRSNEVGTIGAVRAERCCGSTEPSGLRSCEGVAGPGADVGSACESDDRLARGRGRAAAAESWRRCGSVSCSGGTAGGRVGSPGADVAAAVAVVCRYTGRGPAGAHAGASPGADVDGPVRPGPSAKPFGPGADVAFGCAGCLRCGVQRIDADTEICDTAVCTIIRPIQSCAAAQRERPVH